MTDISFAWHDVAGMTGVTLIVLAYLGIQLERLSSKSLAYSLMNLIGAALILLSLYFTFNLPSVIIESFWLLISIIGIVRWWQRR